MRDLVCFRGSNEFHEYDFLVGREVVEGVRAVDGPQHGQEVVLGGTRPGGRCRGPQHGRAVPLGGGDGRLGPRDDACQQEEHENHSEVK